ncbi:hypothetical protein MMC30_005158, partial [Trapelia coarctata]|nr:hypothetical protein [Trapelia coarctata]
MSPFFTLLLLLLLPLASPFPVARVPDVLADAVDILHNIHFLHPFGSSHRSSTALPPCSPIPTSPV